MSKKDPYEWYRKQAARSHYLDAPIEAFDDDNIDAFEDDDEPDVEYLEPDRESYTPPAIGDVSYFPENDFDHREIKAAIADGEIVRWRVDASGTQWYRKLQAIPPQAEQAAASTGILGDIKRMIFGVPARDE